MPDDYRTIKLLVDDGDSIAWIAESTSHKVVVRRSRNLYEPGSMTNWDSWETLQQQVPKQIFGFADENTARV